MNIKHFVAMLKFECKPWLLFGFILYSLMMMGNYVKHFRVEHMFSLSSSAYIFAPMAVFMAFNVLFYNGTWGMKLPAGSANLYYSNPEFLFAQAICRRSQFYAKICLYFFFAMILSLMLLGYSCTKPVIKVELPYNTAAFREQVKQFYLTQFNGATLEKDLEDKEGNKFFVILPNGHVDQAVFGVVEVFIQALLLQAGVFLLGRKPWSLYVVFFCLMLYPVIETVITLVFLGSSSHTQQISQYERSLAWIIQHPLSVVMMLTLSAAALQVYCCKCYIKEEV